MRWETAAAAEVQLIENLIGIETLVCCREAGPPLQLIGKPEGLNEGGADDDRSARCNSLENLID